jgi:LmbE family N-acetylglucosaminyl deacetylase
MKLRIYFQPWLPVFLLGGACALLWGAESILGATGRLVLLPVSIFYSLLFLLAVWAATRTLVLERWTEWKSPGRLLILAPHEDDCVISAGGTGARNARLGGATRIVYLAPDEHQGMAEIRAAEARAAWKEPGIGDGNLRHIELLPPLRSRDPKMLRDAAKTLRSIIDEFKPTTVVVPMFEGGHVHHDMVSALVGLIVRPDDPFEVFEAPEYSPYLSLLNTPHRLLALCTRWLFGVVSYYGPPDGIDDRTILKLRMTPEELAGKRRMLSAFVSQNAPSLMATRSHCDRLVRMEPRAEKIVPFDFDASYLRFVLAARRLVWSRLVDRILPVQLGTIGREPAITDWRSEWNSGVAGQAHGER